MYFNQYFFSSIYFKRELTDVNKCNCIHLYENYFKRFYVA